MPWMIYLAKSQQIGGGCRKCRFLNDMKVVAQCIADENVDVYIENNIRDTRPYGCPFRFFKDSYRQNIKQFEGMSQDETSGWFAGADFQARKYVNLEIDRRNFVKYKKLTMKADSVDGDYIGIDNIGESN